MKDVPGGPEAAAAAPGAVEVEIPPEGPKAAACEPAAGQAPTTLTWNIMPARIDGHRS